MIPRHIEWCKHDLGLLSIQEKTDWLKNWQITEQMTCYLCYTAQYTKSVRHLEERYGHSPERLQPSSRRETEISTSVDEDISSNTRSTLVSQLPSTAAHKSSLCFTLTASGWNTKKQPLHCSACLAFAPATTGNLFIKGGMKARTHTVQYSPAHWSACEK